MGRVPAVVPHRGVAKAKVTFGLPPLSALVACDHNAQCCRNGGPRALPHCRSTAREKGLSGGQGDRNKAKANTISGRHVNYAWSFITAFSTRCTVTAATNRRRRRHSNMGLLGSALFFAILFCVLCGVVANVKGMSAGAWAVGGFFFGVFALIVLLCIPSRKLQYVAVDQSPPAPNVTVNLHFGQTSQGESPSGAAPSEEKQYSAADVVRMMTALGVDATGGAPTQQMQIVSKPCKYCGKGGGEVQALDGRYYHRACYQQAYQNGQT